jgi:hypothetical protein
VRWIPGCQGLGANIIAGSRQTSRQFRTCHSRPGLCFLVTPAPVSTPSSWNSLSAKGKLCYNWVQARSSTFFEPLLWVFRDGHGYLRRGETTFSSGATLVDGAKQGYHKFTLSWLPELFCSAGTTSPSKRLTANFDSSVEEETRAAF